MEHYNPGDAIDAERILFQVKKMIPGAYIQSVTGFRGIKYKCSRDCYATIKSCLTIEQINDIKNSPKSECIFTEISDQLQCRSLFFISETKRRLNCFSVNMMSGRHECHEGTPSCRTYAEIEQPFAHILHAINNKLTHIEKKSLPS